MRYISNTMTDFSKAISDTSIKTTSSILKNCSDCIQKRFIVLLLMTEARKDIMENKFSFLFSTFLKSCRSYSFQKNNLW